MLRYPQQAAWRFSLSFGLVGLLLTCAAGCETDDVGKLCGTTPTAIGASPIGGENPTVEVVRVERDQECRSFQCIQQRGLDGFCSRSCELSDATSTTCEDHGDCKPPLYCLDGQCIDDDCPEGFWCRSVHEVGPLSETHLCIRREDCVSDQDCEAFGEIACVQYRCIDACLLNPSEPCDFHQQICIDDQREEFSWCECANGTSNDTGQCPDSDLVCQPPNSTESWPPGSTIQRSICTQTE